MNNKENPAYILYKISLDGFFYGSYFKNDPYDLIAWGKFKVIYDYLEEEVGKNEPNIFRSNNII